MRTSTIRERASRAGSTARLAGTAILLGLLTACSDTLKTAGTAARDSVPERRDPDAAGTAPWSYRLTNGWLSELEGYEREDPDAETREYRVEHRAECRGNADVRRCGPAECWTWRVSEVECSGTGSPGRLDWLDADSMSVRRDESGWSLAPSLIGRGDCTPELSFDDDGELTRMHFTCEWKCSPGDPCEGGADYEFTRDPAPRAEPASGTPKPSRS